ncbi:MAG TPA: hypothetical protein VEC37_08840 [Bacillota bacterium]|nr:hypothetical protein [Bacillota bacterium]
MKKWILTLAILLVAFQGRCMAAATLTEAENPAAMALSEIRFQLILPEHFFNADNNLFNPENINADLITAEAKKEFLDQLENGEFSADLVTSFKTGVTIGHWGVYLRPWLSGSINLRSGIPQLIFEGYEIGKTYEINDSKAEGIAAGSLDITYGRKLWTNENSTFSGGMTLHYLRGLAVGQGVVTGNNLTTDEWGQAEYDIMVDSSYGVIGDEGFHGEGFLADLGFLYQNKPWSVGLVFKNLGPAVVWEGLTRETTHYTGNITGGPEGPELPEPESTTVTESRANLSTRIPITVHLYGGWQLKESLEWIFGVKKGLKDAWGITTAPLTYMGLDWQPAAAFGITGNLYYYKNQVGLDTALRLKAKIFLFNLAVGWSGGLDNNEASSLNYSFATGLQF